MDFQKTPGFGDDDGYEPACGYDAEIEIFRSCIKQTYTKAKDVTHDKLPRYKNLLAARFGVDVHELKDAFHEVSSIRGIPDFVTRVSSAFPAIRVDGVTAHIVDLRAVVLSPCWNKTRMATCAVNRGHMDTKDRAPRMYYKPHARDAMLSWVEMLSPQGVDPMGKGIRIYSEQPSPALIQLALSTLSVWSGVNETLVSFIRLADKIGVKTASVKRSMRLKVAA